MSSVNAADLLALSSALSAAKQKLRSTKAADCGNQNEGVGGLYFWGVFLPRQLKFSFSRLEVFLLIPNEEAAGRRFWLRRLFRFCISI